MKPDASAIEFASYAASRWRQIAGCCIVAIAIAGVASLLLPKRYTATATLLIEPPAGADPRAATAVSPVYLESLKTYEHLATGDTLFAEALDHQGLRAKYAGRNIESLKSSVLKVSKPSNTRILDVSVTLDDAKAAQGLAQYIAERTATLNHSLDARSAADAAAEARVNFETADKRLKKIQQTSYDYTPMLSGLEAEVSNASELQYNVQRELIDARTDAPARIPELEKQDRELARTIQTKSQQFERAKLNREALDAELKAARAAWESARIKLDDLNASAAFRGERLEMLDPGVVPQRPSFPNTLLNLLVALLVSLVASITYLAFRFGYENARVSRHERVFSRIA